MSLIAFFASFTVFTSAWLLFLAEPVITKLMIPTLGGAPQVWNTAMVFFQFCLLLGYMAAHIILKLPDRKIQLALYAGFLCLTFLFLPFCLMVPVHIDPIHDPALWVLTSLTLSLMAPFLLLSMSNTLVQGFLVQSNVKTDFNPYTLYAASNAGSLCALISFFVLEYFFPLSGICLIWSKVFYLFAAMLLFALFWLIGQKPNAEKEKISVFGRPRIKECLTWCWLAFIPSALFLSVTTYISTDVASVPLLWVVPLALYLVTFILGFAKGQPGVKWALSARPMAIVIAGLLITLNYGGFPPAMLFIHFVHIATFFILALCCHGLLARIKPHPHYLSLFYLWVAIGGVLGGLFSSLLAPNIFNEAVEYPLLLLAACLIGTSQLVQKPRWQGVWLQIGWVGGSVLLLYVVMLMLGTHETGVDSWINVHFTHLASLGVTFHSAIFLLAVICTASFAGAFHAHKIPFMLCMTLLLFSHSLYHDNTNTLYLKRNFFGVSRVYYDAKRGAMIFKHGSTIHSIQPRDEKERLKAASYYGPVERLHAMLEDNAALAPTAVVGLGAGTVLCIDKKRGEFDLFEIDPHVVEIAKDSNLFTYMRDCGAQKHIYLGDGRISLAHMPEHYYGLIIMDAFSSDAIPVHLLTREAVNMYLSKLAPGGIIAFNVSNRYFNLVPMFASLAKSLSLEGYSLVHNKLRSPYELASMWIFMSRSLYPEQRMLAVQLGWMPLVDSGKTVWTDQYSNLLPYLQ